MESVLDMAVDSEKFESVKELQGGPVSNEEVIKNIRASAGFKLPVLNKQAEKEGALLFVAGGPSLIGFIEELRERKAKGEVIATSNNTHDYLIENGIVPDICCVIDPKECVKDYIKKPIKGIRYIIGTVCHPSVAQGLIDKGMDVELMCVGYGVEDESDLAAQKELYPSIPVYAYLVGGTMMGLRAMPFAYLLGYRKIEYYGFDSCFANDFKVVNEGEPEFEKIKAENDGRFYDEPETGKRYVISEAGGFFYAYKKKRNENVQVARTADGRKFLTSPVFAHQAKQFIKWIDRMEGKIDVIVHGDNLSSHLLKLHREELSRANKEVEGKRWTDKYQALQKQLHSEGHYGVWGDMDIEVVGRAVLAMHSKLKRRVRLLDYACGHGALQRKLREVFSDKVLEVVGYDPFVPEFEKEPEGVFDIVTCFDAFEHIEYQCVRNVIKHLSGFVKYMAMLLIATEDANKLLPDGRNAHITQRSPKWWGAMLGEKMLIVEATTVPGGVSFVCQSPDAKEEMDKETAKSHA